MTDERSRAKLDPWAASSLLQKAIRRGAYEHALYAAQTLFRQRGNAVWRRFLIVGYEDVGLGDLDAVVEATTLAADPDRRREMGTDAQVIAHLCFLLSSAAGDRSTDYLICTIKQHPDYEQLREDIAPRTILEQIALALNPRQPMIRRAMAWWYASGVNGGGQQIVGEGNLHALLSAAVTHGVSSKLCTAAKIAVMKTKEPIAALLPFLAMIHAETGGTVETVNQKLPPSPEVAGLPLYMFDKHTSIGKRAVRQLILQNGAIDACLSRYVADHQAQAVAQMACFYLDATPVYRRPLWKHAEELEQLGTEVDMLKVGCPKEGIKPILDTFRAHLGDLNRIRATLFSRS